MSPIGSSALTQQLLRSVSVFRWAALVWASVGVVLSQDELDRPYLASALLGAAGLFTILTGYLAARRANLLASPLILVFELALGVVLLLGDGLVYAPERSQSLPWAWPAAGIIAIGVCLGQRAGLASALLIASASLFTELVVLDRSLFVAAFSKIGLWMLAGALAGAVTARLRAAEQEISIVRTREEVARELHDGVLQTLAVVQRRSKDPELASLAKDQENSLRRYLSDGRISDASIARGAELEPSLRDVAAKAERMYGLQVQVIVAPDCPEVPGVVVQAITGAATEALTNAAKHGGASNVVIFAEPSDVDFDEHHGPNGLFVSIKDDGSGFDSATVVEGIGLGRSIRGRIEEQGGTTIVVSRPDRGTEVKLWN